MQSCDLRLAILTIDAHVQILTSWLVIMSFYVIVTDHKRYDS